MNELLKVILETIWFLLPAGVANTMPVIVANWRSLAWLGLPLDGGKTWRGERLLGDHKTVRGLLVGLIFGSITGYFQHIAFETQPIIQSISLVSYRSVIGALALGAWLGLGALFGDALKSFVKRQLKINPGNPWRPFDQIDSVIGVLLISWWLIPLTLWHAVIAILGVWFASFVMSVLGVQLKIKKTI